MNKKGFTLIELLVVVLIIGILSAVALPQYQKTVLKSRTAEAWTNLNALHKALSEYCLANPSYYGDFSDVRDSLSINVSDTDKFSYGGDLTCRATPYIFNVSAVYKGGNSATSFHLGINPEGRRFCGGDGCSMIGAKGYSTSPCMCGACGAVLCYYLD